MAKLVVDVADLSTLNSNLSQLASALKPSCGVHARRLTRCRDNGGLRPSAKMAKLAGFYICGMLTVNESARKCASSIKAYGQTVLNFARKAGVSLPALLTRLNKSDS